MEQVRRANSLENTIDACVGAIWYNDVPHTFSSGGPPITFCHQLVYEQMGVNSYTPKNVMHLLKDVMCLISDLPTIGLFLITKNYPQWFALSRIICMSG